LLASCAERQLAQPVVYIVIAEQDLRCSFAFLLEAYGFAALAFASPEGFLAAYSPGSPGCLLLTQEMPRTTGMACLVRLRRRAVALPTIVVAQVVTARLRRRGSRLGAVLVESLSADAVLEAVGRALSAGPSCSSNDA
jgi:FixJ family two-component response regulator